MIEMKQCCKVPFPEKLFEQYERWDGGITANVSASKVMDMMRQFISMHDEPLFFILEIPTSQQDEAMLQSEPGVLHKDVYYIDGCTKEYALQILDGFGNFLIKDGLNSFGFGGHMSHEEILFEKYNVLTIFSSAAEPYQPFLESYGITQTDRLVTAWNTFSPEHGGECTRYESEGKSIFDIPGVLEPFGMYLAERREDE